MTAKLNEDIIAAVNRQDRPLEVRDEAGKIYIIMTSQQFQKYVYDDSELSPDEMRWSPPIPGRRTRGRFVRLSRSLPVRLHRFASRRDGAPRPRPFLRSLR